MSVEYVTGDLLRCRSHSARRQLSLSPWFEFHPSTFYNKNIYGKRRSQHGRNLAVYEDRGTPGTIVTYKGDTKLIIALLAQWDYGTTNKLHQRDIPPYRDTKDERTQWFKECLKGDLDVNTIAFPYKVGCHLGGQPWPLYEQLIGQFARQTGKRVLIVQKLG